MGKEGRLTFTKYPLCVRYYDGILYTLTYLIFLTPSEAGYYSHFADVQTKTLSCPKCLVQISEARSAWSQSPWSWKANINNLRLCFACIPWRNAWRTWPCASSGSQCLCSPAFINSFYFSLSFWVLLFFLSFSFFSIPSLSFLFHSFSYLLLPFACPSNAFSLTFSLPLISFWHFSLSLTLGLSHFYLPTSFSPSCFLNHNFSGSFLPLSSLKFSVLLYHSLPTCYIFQRVPGIKHLGLCISGSKFRLREQVILPSPLVLPFDGRVKKLT